MPLKTIFSIYLKNQFLNLNFKYYIKFYVHIHKDFKTTKVLFVMYHVQLEYLFVLLYNYVIQNAERFVCTYLVLLFPKTDYVAK